jgi:hypothetical protein
MNIDFMTEISISKFSDGFIVFHVNKETNASGSTNRLSDIYNKVFCFFLIKTFRINFICLQNIKG